MRCRWAESSLNECGDVCKGFPANLNERDVSCIPCYQVQLDYFSLLFFNQCELQYEETGQIGRYAIALQVEDFGSSVDIMPLSSVPVQFLAQIFNSTQPCSSQPEFVGTTPLDGSCIVVPFNASWSTSIIARVSNQSTATSIAEIVTASPLGMRQSVLSPTCNTGEWSMNVTWTPTQSQYGPNIFCYFALDNLR